MKILIAADGSSYTSKAVEYVVTHLAMFRDNPEVHVLHVQVPIPASEGHAAFAIGLDAVENYYGTEAQAALAPSEAILKKNNIAFKGGYCIGDVAQQINAYAQEHNIDLIVMGTHGHSAFKNLVMGSVATKVLATTAVPVLLVR